MDVVTVSFRIEYKNQPNETVHITGSPEVLGMWDPAQCANMRKLPPKWEPPVGSGRAPPEQHTWEAIVEVPESDAKIEYRFLIRSPDAPDRIEDGSKHILHVKGMGGSRQRCTDSWRGT